MSYNALLPCWCCFVITQLKHLHASLECKQADCCIGLHLYTKLPCISEAGSISVHKLSVLLKVASNCREHNIAVATTWLKHKDHQVGSPK